ncbi:hypothetical protein [Alloalcanivorax mobilis]|nr:hypothetical protein [Alloalcanivorax mobilis]|tara:strand:+ start:29466 stop:29597 length:132 start_codon:yes stop_codon:yes gene_type:complete
MTTEFRYPTRAALWLFDATVLCLPWFARQPLQRLTPLLRSSRR